VDYFVDPTLVGLESAVSNNLSQQSQRIAMNSILPQRQYEVTENNDMVLKQQQPVQSVILQSSIINPHQQFDGFFSNHLVNSNTGIVKSRI